MAERTVSIEETKLELYFLIAKFLSQGPCHESSKVLKNEMIKNQLLPKRIDWTGKPHLRSFEELIEINKHLSADHLYKICQRLLQLSNQQSPYAEIKGISSLLGAGKFSVLSKDTKSCKASFRHIHNNIVSLVSHKQTWDIVPKSIPDSILSKFTRQFKSLGHLSSVYCLLFDRTGHYIFTGSDDNLVKAWSAVTGRLLFTFRGHSAEISDMAVSHNNQLLAVGSCDKLIRVWSLKTSAPVAVLQAHTHMVTSLRFSPYTKDTTQYLASSGGDGCLCVWQYDSKTNVFNTKPTKFIERSRPGTQMLCLSFSSGGGYLATGSSDYVVRVYSIGGKVAEKICELESHVDRIDSIQYANHDLRFATGSRDGHTRIYRYERSEWRALVINTAQSSSHNDSSSSSLPSNLRVTMVAWSQDDTFVFTAVSDNNVKVWDSFTGELVHCFKGHTDEVYVLEPNPVDKRILLSAGHDGCIILWDIFLGTKLKSFTNDLEGQGFGMVYDCKWSPNGLEFAATDSYGYLLMYGIGSNEKFRKLPEELYFHTDYRPVIRDSQHNVLDEQTQLPPHFLPPPFLVDIDGNPHPPEYQRLVPGREDCNDMSQLLPVVVVAPNGSREVIDDLNGEILANNNNNNDLIDELIARMQNNEDNNNNNNPNSDNNNNSLAISLSNNQPSAQTINRVNQSEEHEGQPINMCVWARRDLIRQYDQNTLRSIWETRIAVTEEEKCEVAFERKKKPIKELFNDNEDSNDSIKQKMRIREKKLIELSNRNEERGRNRLERRALYDTDQSEQESVFDAYEDEEEEEEEASRDFSFLNISNNKASSDSDSTEYSDWSPDGRTFKPPIRQSSRKKRTISKSKWNKFLANSKNEDDDDEDDEDDDESVKKGKKKVASEESMSCKRSKRRMVLRSSDEEEEPIQQIEPSSSQQISPQPSTSFLQPQPSTSHLQPSTSSSQPNTSSIFLPKHVSFSSSVKEVPAEFRPPEWLTTSVPSKAPYFPQMGDEVVYFKQGHQLYLDAVKATKAYSIQHTFLPAQKHPSLKEHELMKVVGIKYEIKPPRLVCLKLAFIDPDTSKLTGGTFTIKYHDMVGVIDFVVLRHAFNVANQRKWKDGDKFRCLIDNNWWNGTLLRHQPLQQQYPQSLFQCLCVRWDNGEEERLSPWDLEPVNSSKPSEGGCIEATIEEIAEVGRQGYVHKPHEWPSHCPDIDCDRIAQALEGVMGLSIAEPFLVPVDLNAFPLYALVIEYPVDLSLIKERLINRFYRRLAAVQYDIRHIDRNARSFNQPNSLIVNNAKLVTDLCLEVTTDAMCYDIMPIYNRLTQKNQGCKKIQKNQKENIKKHVVAGSDEDDEEEDGDHSNDFEASESSEMHLRRQTRNMKIAERLRQRHKKLWKGSNDSRGKDWKLMCTKLLDSMLRNADSIPFQHPVDLHEFPDYLHVVGSSMDLSTIRSNLESNKYQDISGFIKHCRQVFINSRRYNTNRRSKIFIMTLRLSSFFEEQLKRLLKSTKPEPASKMRAHLKSFSTTRREQKKRERQSESSPEKPAVKKRRIIHYDDEEDEVRTDEKHKTPLENNKKIKVESNNVKKRNRKYVTNYSHYEDEEEEEDDSNDDDFEVDDDDDDYDYRGRIRQKKNKKKKKQVYYSEDEDEDEEEDEDDDDDLVDSSGSEDPMPQKKKKEVPKYKGKGKKSKGQKLSKNEIKRRQDEEGCLTRRSHLKKTTNQDEANYHSHNGIRHSSRHDNHRNNNRSNNNNENFYHTRKSTHNETTSRSCLFISIKKDKSNNYKTNNIVKNGHVVTDDELTDTEDLYKKKDASVDYLGNDYEEDDDEFEHNDDYLTGSDTETYSNRSSHFSKKINKESKNKSKHAGKTKDNKYEKKSKNRASSSSPRKRQAGISTRNQGRRTVLYAEEDEEEAVTTGASFSSRGRLHKPSSRLLA